jgi:hypothetical protein
MTSRAIAVLGLLAVLVVPGAASGDALALLAELPSSGSPGDLSPRRLEPGGPVFLVSVAANAIETWPAGTISEPVVSPGPGTAIRGFPAFGDFDGDGRIDVAVSVATGIQVFAGDGNGRFRAVLGIPDDGARPLAAGDVDGDGRSDLIVGAFSPGGAVLRTFQSLGEFRFAPPRDTPGLPSGSNSGSFTAGDVDGDGRSDVVVASDGSASVWISRGDGTFVAAPPLQEPQPADEAILADLDLDGFPDLLLAHQSLRYRTVVALQNDGAGIFHRLPFSEVSTFAERLTVGDFDGDGVLDIATVPVTEAPCSYTLTVYPGDGRGGFGTARRLPVPCVPGLGLITRVTAIDWDGDGTMEIAASASRGPVVLSPPRTAYDDVLFVPVLVSTSGVGGVRFESDLLVTNSGTTRVRLALVYVATAGEGSGTVAADLEPGAQLHAPSALGWLRAAGLPIAETGPSIGTLRIEVTGASALHAVRASVLTKSSAGGGTSTPALTRTEALRGNAIVPWLTEAGRDRTNLALANAGAAEDGPVTLRVTVASGAPAAPGLAELPDVELPPGAFFQLNRVLLASRLPCRVAWARIRRVAGNAPYVAWATVNDAVTGDASIVAAVPEDRPEPWRFEFPAAVQSERFATELVLTNPGEEHARATFGFAGLGTFAQDLAPGEVFVVGDLFAEMRRRDPVGALPAGVPFVGSLAVTGVLGGVRVTTTRGSARFGVFEPPAANEAASVVLPDLRRDSATRTNLAIANGYGFGGPHRFRLEVHDGETGRLAGSRDVTLERGARLQLDDVLQELVPRVSRAWARIVPAYPTLFSAYAVVMDGAAPGEGSDDGAFIPGIPEEVPAR